MVHNVSIPCRVKMVLHSRTELAFAWLCQVLNWSWICFYLLFQPCAMVNFVWVMDWKLQSSLWHLVNCKFFSNLIAVHDCSEVHLRVIDPYLMYQMYISSKYLQSSRIVSGSVSLLVCGISGCWNPHFLESNPYLKQALELTLWNRRGQICPEWLLALKTTKIAPKCI